MTVGGGGSLRWKVSSMEKKAEPKILLYQGIGFLTIIALSWLDDWLGLSSLIFGEHPWLPEFHQSALVMLFILVTWLLVANATRRVLERVKYLERFMRVCAWCRRIDYKGRWVKLEEFLQQSFDTPTSHGICQECFDKVNADIENARRKRAAQAADKPNPQKAPGENNSPA
jgi:hypothetical protein